MNDSLVGSRHQVVEGEMNEGEAERRAWRLGKRKREEERGGNKGGSGVRQKSGPCFIAEQGWTAGALTTERAVWFAGDNRTTRSAPNADSRHCVYSFPFSAKRPSRYSPTCFHFSLARVSLSTNTNTLSPLQRRPQTHNKKELSKATLRARYGQSCYLVREEKKSAPRLAPGRNLSRAAGPALRTSGSILLVFLRLLSAPIIFTASRSSLFID